MSRLARITAYHAALWRELALFFLIGFVLLTIALVADYSLRKRTVLAEREANQRLVIVRAKATVSRHLQAVTTDIRLLANASERLTFFVADSPSAQRNLTELFEAYSVEKTAYDQIRYLSTAGKELLRVNRGPDGPLVVAPELLQNKADRYYVGVGRELAAGEVYISRLDLNVERGQVEVPFNPTLRFVIPVFDAFSRRRGMLVLNYRAGRLLNDLHLAGDGQGTTPMFLNDQGFWLSGPQRSLEWAFMFGKTNTFADQYPRAWEVIKTGDFGQFMTDAGLFSYATAGPSPAGRETDAGAHHRNDEQWKIVTLIAAKELSGLVHISRDLPIYLVFLVLIAIGSALLARKHVAYRFQRSRQEFEDQFRGVLEHVNLAAMVLTSDGRVSFCNPALQNVLKRGETDIIGKDWITLTCSEETRDDARTRFANLLNSERDYHDEEAEVFDKTGHRHTIAWSHTVLDEIEGVPKAMLCIGRDVTGERHANMELLKVTQAVVQSPNTVMIVNMAREIEYVNPKFTELTGYLPEEVIGKNPNILKSGETSPDDYQALWNTILAGGTWRGVFHNRKKNGEMYWEAARISGIRNQDGEVTHFVAVKEDITERRRLEDTVRARDRELARAEAFTVMGKMASMIAHDLRNPLSSIKMTLQILNRQGTARKQDQDIELTQISLTQIGHMEETLEDLLAYSRPDSLRSEWIDIARVLETAVNQIQKALHDHDVQLDMQVRSGLPTIYADAPKLSRVFANLFLNSVQAMEGIADRKSRISVTAKIELADDHPSIVVNIQDNGRGIDDAARAQIFEPFFTTRVEGTGLGLAIAKRIIEQHHGSICIDTGEEIGASITVMLPTGLAPPGDPQ